MEKFVTESSNLPQISTKQKRPSGRGYARAGWSIAIVFLAEFFSLLPLITFAMDNGSTTPSLTSNMELLVTDMLVNSGLSQGAAKQLAFASLSHLSYLVFALAALFASRFVTREAVLLGRSDKSSILWIGAAVIAACTIDISIDLYDYAAGHLQAWGLFRPGCGSYVISAEATRSIVIFLFALSLPVVIGPLCEEILYRGILGNSLPPVLGNLGSAVLSSALFALSHLGRLNSFLDFADYFLMGLVFFSARTRFGGIGVPLAAHMAVNSFFTFDALLRC